MILLFLIVRRMPTIRELVVATLLSLSAPSATARLTPPRSGLERSDFVPRPEAGFPVADEPKLLRGRPLEESRRQRGARL